MCTLRYDLIYSGVWNSRVVVRLFRVCLGSALGFGVEGVEGATFKVIKKFECPYSTVNYEWVVA